MILVTLAHAQKHAVTDKATKFKRGVEVDVFAEDEVVRDIGLGGRCLGRIVWIGHTTVKWMLQVVCDEVAALQEEVYIIWRSALKIVRR